MFKNLTVAQAKMIEYNDPTEEEILQNEMFLDISLDEIDLDLLDAYEAERAFHINPTAVKDI